MKYQPKVNQTQQYSDSQGEHIVHKGKFLLIDPEWVGNDQQPIIISETEEIEVGDWYLDDANQIRQSIIDDKKYWSNRSDYNKILALPEHFSDKHLQAIVDGKMKDGDEVLVKCQAEYSNNMYGSKLKGYYIHLNQQNHITLFPVKQSLEEVAYEYAKGQDAIDEYAIGFMAGAKWAKENNY